jgi:glycosyltransferase involved in cell wall biosynthesis
VLTWHNDLPPVSLGASVLVGLHSAVSPLYLDHFQRIIATTGVYARRSETLRRYRDRVTVIPNGVDTRKFNPGVNGDPVRERYGLRGKVVLFVGALTRWHGYKGLDVLLKAFRTVKDRLGDARLVVVGDGPMRDVYEGLAREYGLGSSVTFAGYADDSTLPLYYAACDLLVLPSKDSSEGFGLVLLEAMASGKAVIGTKVGGITEVIKDSENGVIVNPHDFDALVIAIVLLLEDDNVRRRMGANGRRFAELNDWSHVAAEVERLYAELQ